MTTTADKCPLCGGTLVPGTTTYTADLGTGVVLVRDVPATICDQCGEDWVANDAASRLLGIVEEARDKHAIVEVLNY
ncbi:MAG: type II toxin-antitoxin system MqsA family antitoxin [Candidatus Hydrogenedentes bacterium]|nr:type II toxin-antitoxin system MqsA family antitoxin [Candidatus Hydrogenedentota bacterium]